jgi:hypothetical protein
VKEVRGEGAGATYFLKGLPLVGFQEYSLTLANSCGVRSTNATVRNALNARTAKNEAANAKYKAAIIKPEAGSNPIRYAVYVIEESGRRIGLARHLNESDAIDVALKSAPHVKREPR